LLKLFWVSALAILLTASANAAHTQVRLILSAETARPGDTVLAGLHLKMEPKWHTYWKNPGAAGMATEIKWELPPGITAGEIQWPLPKKMPPDEVTTYGYENEVVLIVPLTLAADLKPGPLNLKADLKWLECKEQCIPGKGSVAATLNVSSETKASSDVAVIESWKDKLPRHDAASAFRGTWEKPTSDDTRPLIIANQSSSGADKNIKYDSVDFYPDANDQFEVQASVEVLSAFSADLRLRKVVKKFSGDWPKEISGVMVVEANGQRFGSEVKIPITDNGSASAPHSSTPFSWPALLSGLAFAFLGGLILNIMPCVLPVIALKIFSFVKQSGEEPGRARRLGLIYALGILFSFLVLAGFLIALQEAGHVASWGSQMQNKNFLLGMTILVTLVSLNLFGLFEVTLGGAMNAASNLSNKSGPSGAFFNGVLATALAIPCTAPFLTTALAFAFGQPPLIILLTFSFIALGLAAPYIVLTWNPKLLKFLPKPGAWMNYFKIALGFPMLMTVIWLYKLSLNHLTKSQSLWFGIFLVTLGLAAWIWGEFVQRGSRRRGLAGMISLILVAGVGAYAATRHEGLKWERWSQAAVDKARAEGRPVLVDFTADWCATCQFNLHTSIDIRRVREKLVELHAVTLLADFTVQDETIGRELHRFGRDAVPLVVVFPKNPAAEPIILPPVLKPQIVLDALERARK
jgi:thiol:disulfide interchange protein DsbD